jgi:alkylation response protein AidB-like acyl-CoA dehydrogenase
MSEYSAPLKDMRFAMNELAGLPRVIGWPDFEEVTADVVDAVLDEAARFAGGVLSPLNRSGDAEGARWRDGRVTTPQGFAAAYRQFIDGGWTALGAPTAFGGQTMPKLAWTPVQEMWKSANLSFSAAAQLTQGAIEALEHNASDALKQTFLPAMISGRWTGTMNLTEPQAGSDLSAVRTRAVRADDGSYRISGHKIFITFGEHDMAENIVHLVLARTPDAPAGTKGISMFVVPKFLVNADGSLGARNDVVCASIEHKLGFHGSPTCVMVYGERDGAVGYLVGQENRGLEHMFVMMNSARFTVGLEGVAMAERAYQHAVAYARQRRQGRDAVTGEKSVPIVRHPDVRRMLLLMRAQTEAMRALAYVVAAALDAGAAHPDGEERERARRFVDLMIPVVKGWSTETAIEVASLGIQVHGGMGFIEETGAAQYLRDARITAIYEGTTGIQAMDLVGRKIARDNGRALAEVLSDMRSVVAGLESREADADLAAIRTGLAEGARALEEAGAYVAMRYGTETAAVLAAAVPFLKLLGIVAGGWQMGRAAIIAQQRLDAGHSDAAFYRAKKTVARFYADHVLSAASGLAATVIRGSNAVLALADDEL